jgi:hypothetical protein
VLLSVLLHPLSKLQILAFLSQALSKNSYFTLGL